VLQDWAACGPVPSDLTGVRRLFRSNVLGAWSLGTSSRFETDLLAFAKIVEAHSRTR